MGRAVRGQTSLYGSDGRRKYLTPSERARFIAASWSHPRANVGTLCLFLAFTGCRISEALEASSSSVGREDLFVAIRCLKKRAKFVVREIPVPRELVIHLQTVHDFDCADRHLWAWSRGRAWFLVREVMTQAGIPSGPHATAKGLRHGFAVNALRCHVPLNLVQRWLGHASLATTAIYLDAMGDEEREIALRMWSEADLAH